MTINIFLSGLPEINPKKVIINRIQTISIPLHKFLCDYLYEVYLIIFKEDDLKEGYVILLDGTNIMQLQGINTKVVDGVTLVITAQVVGG